MESDAIGDTRMSVRRRRVALLTGSIVLSMAALLVVSSPHSLAASDPQQPPVDAAAQNPNVRLKATKVPSALDGGETNPVGLSKWMYRQRESSCEGVEGATACLRVACADPNEIGYLVERRLRNTQSDGWQLDGTLCEGPSGPILTPGLILDAVRRVGLPSMSVQAPPETFVNYETVVYTRADTFARTVTLLGFTVDIEATPSQFHWSYGDGVSETTTTAGRPYPATDITHTWTDAHRTFHPSVDVTYQIRFRVDGGAWRTLADTITIQGPNGDVRIREATGMLTNMR
jgi:hypothetical protein